MKTSKGFTLIELVVVIVILGILAAVALPKFVDLSGDARVAAAQGAAAALSSATSVNYASYAARGGTGGGAVAVTGANATAVCETNVAALNGLVTGVSFTTGTASGNNQFKIAAATGSATCTAGTSVTCNVTPTGGLPSGLTQPVAVVVCTG